MNRFFVLTSFVLLMLANGTVLADETLYETQAIDGVEYIFKTSPYGATVVRLWKMEENMSDRLVLPKRLGGRKVIALEGRRLPDEPQDVSLVGPRDRRSLVNDKGAIGFKHIVLPDGIELIGDEAFEHCNDIVSVDLPDSVLDIGYSAFRGCTSLTKIKIPRHIEVIKASTFSQCSGLQEILIPESLQKIESFAFDGCGYCWLTGPKISKGVSDYAISHGLACDNKDTSLPSGVGEVDPDLFWEDMSPAFVAGRSYLVLSNYLYRTIETTCDAKVISLVNKVLIELPVIRDAFNKHADRLMELKRSVDEKRAKGLDVTVETMAAKRIVEDEDALNKRINAIGCSVYGNDNWVYMLTRRPSEPLYCDL